MKETCADDIPRQSEYNNDKNFDNKVNDNDSYSYDKDGIKDAEEEADDDADSNDGNDEEYIEVETKKMMTYLSPLVGGIRKIKCLKMWQSL